MLRMPQQRRASVAMNCVQHFSHISAVFLPVTRLMSAVRWLISFVAICWLASDVNDLTVCVCRTPAAWMPASQYSESLKYWTLAELVTGRPTGVTDRLTINDTVLLIDIWWFQYTWSTLTTSVNESSVISVSALDNLSWVSRGVRSQWMLTNRVCWWTVPASQTDTLYTVTCSCVCPAAVTDSGWRQFTDCHGWCLTHSEWWASTSDNNCYFKLI